MQKVSLIVPLLVSLAILPRTGHTQDNTKIQFDFFGDSIYLEVDPSIQVPFSNTGLSDESIADFFKSLDISSYHSILNTLLEYKKNTRVDDWIYYQLIRKTAQHLSPKAENYYRYTLYKWFFLIKSGYDATLSMGNDKLLFYVQSHDNIYNIPYRIRDGKQYVCLNYHDYGGYIDFDKEKFREISHRNAEQATAFSYKITRLPNFRQEDYQEKEIHFTYYADDEQLKVKLNPQIRTIFINYPITDYNYHFNIPLSHDTYNSLIPVLKKKVSQMKLEKGVDYLMRFTRYAFLFEKDLKTFGREKRLSPEETLLYEQSDCEDRAALFFYLVKEIYNLPMIVLSYPQHVTIAVKLDKPLGNAIEYNGIKYSVCEPTPQRKDLDMGKMIPELRKAAYEVAYVYTPAN